MKNALTVDIEDYFQVSAFEKVIDRSDWEILPCRVEQNTDKVLQIFADHKVKGTFFILGWVAERYPQLIKRIAERGHEIASHGWDHVRVIHMTKDQFRDDLEKTKALLEDLSGTQVNGYRAPSYSIGSSNLWALEVLQETGHKYSSSIYPIHHDLYGMPKAPRFAFYPNDLNLIEVPVTTTKVFGKNFPCGGGGYFRLLPYLWSKRAINKVNKVDGESAVFYFHPWEIDPEQPRQSNTNIKTRFRHYTNLSKMEHRLQLLLQDFSWDRMDNVFLQDKELPRIELR